MKKKNAINSKAGDPYRSLQTFQKFKKWQYLITFTIILLYLFYLAICNLGLDWNIQQ